MKIVYVVREQQYVNKDNDGFNKIQIWKKIYFEM
jgi:hypothetical protein